MLPPSFFTYFFFCEHDPSEIIADLELKTHVLLLSMLKTVVLLNIIV